MKEIWEIAFKMKALKIIGISLAATIVALLGIGVVVPSYEYQSSIQVNASPEKCWKVFHNTKLMSQWMDGFESLKLKSGDSLTLGSQYEIVVHGHDKRMTMSEKIIEVNAPTKVSYELKNDVLKSEFTFSFEGSSSTTITSHYKISGNNVLWKSILFLSKSYMTKASQDQLSLLKKVIEEQK
jgi:uncharacterized protein YndB with AHSA1/START domain